LTANPWRASRCRRRPGLGFTSGRPDLSAVRGPRSVAVASVREPSPRGRGRRGRPLHFLISRGPGGGVTLGPLPTTGEATVGPLSPTGGDLPIVSGWVLDRGSRGWSFRCVR
jgi:hypothetical protein